MDRIQIFLIFFQLEEKIREKINDEFKEKVSLQNECELFVRLVSLSCRGLRCLTLSSTISSAIVIQLRELESACEPAFSTMANSMWSTLSQVSGPSPYTADLVRAAEQVIEVIKPTVEQKKYLRNFFDKACRYVVVTIIDYHNCNFPIFQFADCQIYERPGEE